MGLLFPFKRAREIERALRKHAGGMFLARRVAPPSRTVPKRKDEITPPFCTHYLVSTRKTEKPLNKRLFFVSYCDRHEFSGAFFSTACISSVK